MNGNSLPIGNGFVKHGHFVSNGNPCQLLERQASVKILHFILQYNYTEGRKTYYVRKDVL